MAAEVMSGRWPAPEDSLERTDSEPAGHHLRETTEDGYPLMGSSPAERAKRSAESVRIRAQAMRDHPFEGDGPYCQARIPWAPTDSEKYGVITGWSGCGYRADLHPPRLTP